jgi:hypothetical protein
MHATAHKLASTKRFVAASQIPDATKNMDLRFALGVENSVNSESTFCQFDYPQSNQ